MGKKAAKKDKSADAARNGQISIRLADHPRALHHIRKARAWGGLVGLVLAGLAAHGAQLTSFDVGVRALAGGIAGTLIVWAVALAAWRHLALAEVRARIAPAAVATPVPAGGGSAEGAEQ